VGSTTTAAEHKQLVALFNAKRFVELEAHASLLVEQYPASGFSWKVLGAALNAQGKDALPAMQKAAQFSPDDANVHLNLGDMLCGLCQYDDAVTSYLRALVIKPDYAEAHNNLGTALKNLGQLNNAETSYRRALKHKPDFIAAHYNLGNALSELGQIDNAVASYSNVLKLNPNIAEAHSNLGIALKDLGRFDAAVASFRAALKINPNLAEVHSNLGVALKDLGQLDEAVASYRRAVELDPDYAEAHYNLGNVLRDLGQVVRAMASYRHALKIKPDYAEAHSNLGNALRDIGHLDCALESCRHALEINPYLAEQHGNLGNVQYDLGQLNDAEASYRRALELKPDYAETHSNLGNVLHDLGQLDNAVESFRRALELKPNLAKTHSNLGGILMELGKKNEAELFLNKAIELAPGDARPLATALFYIPCQQNDPRLNQLEAIYAQRRTLPLEERIRLNYAMGKAMKNIGQYDRSFTAYEEANRLRYQAHPFDEASDERFLEESCSFFNSELFNKFASMEESLQTVQDERVPIFIVGMPRSGTTLIEQILASHPAIYGAGELSILGKIAKMAKALPLDFAGCEGTLLALRELGQEYLGQVWKLAPNARYITDKLPANYQHLGLIHLMLPNAKIIHSMRDPMDTCFSCYALSFRSEHEYSNDLGMLGRHYLRYRKLMEHWHSVLPPGRILDVHYEYNVADPEHKARRMLDFLGLAWDPACLRFYETERAVLTPSVLQVHKPIYTSSVGRWKYYEKHLKSLLGILNPVKSPECITTTY
jgi:tetratricopeptide (TPR) repeat protein